MRIIIFKANFCFSSCKSMNFPEHIGWWPPQLLKTFSLQTNFSPGDLQWFKTQPIYVQSHMIKIWNDKLFKSWIQFNIFAENCFHSLKWKKNRLKFCKWPKQETELCWKKKREEKIFGQAQIRACRACVGLAVPDNAASYFSLWEREDWEYFNPFPSDPREHWRRLPQPFKAQRFPCSEMCCLNTST